MSCVIRQRNSSGASSSSPEGSSLVGIVRMCVRAQCRGGATGEARGRGHCHWRGEETREKESRSEPLIDQMVRLYLFFSLVSTARVTSWFARAKRKKAARSRVWGNKNRGVMQRDSRLTNMYQSKVPRGIWRRLSIVVALLLHCCCSVSPSIAGWSTAYWRPPWMKRRSGSVVRKYVGEAELGRR